MDRLQQEAQKAEEALALARLELREQTQEGGWGGAGAGAGGPPGVIWAAPPTGPTFTPPQRRRRCPG